MPWSISCGHNSRRIALRLAMHDEGNDPYEAIAKEKQRQSLHRAAASCDVDELLAIVSVVDELVLI
jgi:hypothetical protein